MAKFNLCVKTEAVERMRCKNAPRVHSLAEAKQRAYRMIRRGGLVPGSHLYIYTQPKGRERSKKPYAFVVLHGRVDCHVGSPWGKSCD
jgi:hypothetical protein